jgi:hypothetical protein
VRTGITDATDRTWTTLLFLTEDGSALIARAGWRSRGGRKGFQSILTQ